MNEILEKNWLKLFIIIFFVLIFSIPSITFACWEIDYKRNTLTQVCPNYMIDYIKMIEGKKIKAEWEERNNLIEFIKQTEDEYTLKIPKNIDNYTFEEVKLFIKKREDQYEKEIVNRKNIIKELEELNIRHYPQQHSTEYLKELFSEERQRVDSLKKAQEEDIKRIAEEKLRARRESDKKLERQQLLEKERERIREIVRQELEEEMDQAQPINNQTVQTNITPPTSQPVIQQSLQEENINTEEIEESTRDTLDEGRVEVEEIRGKVEKQRPQNIFQRVRFRISNFFSRLF